MAASDQVPLDPNVLIQESKVGTCDIQPGRRPTGPELLTYVRDYQSRAGLNAGHHTPIKTEDGADGDQ